MEYDTEFWNNFTDQNCSKSNEEFAKFIFDLVNSLHSTSVLEVGCNVGNDLEKFPETFDVNGMDLNERAINLAKKQYPNFKFKKGSILEIPYEDSSIDFVFTHNVLNYIPQEHITRAIKELYRVSKKYILNCESFKEKDEDISKIGTPFWNRNLYDVWLNFNVKIISNVEMHEDIEPKKPKFTLVRKLS